VQPALAPCPHQRFWQWQVRGRGKGSVEGAVCVGWWGGGGACCSTTKPVSAPALHAHTLRQVRLGEVAEDTSDSSGVTDYFSEDEESEIQDRRRRQRHGLQPAECAAAQHRVQSGFMETESFLPFILRWRFCLNRRYRAVYSRQQVEFAPSPARWRMATAPR